MEVTGLLGVSSKDHVIVRSRRYLINDQPVETAVSYIPAETARDTRIAQPDSGPGGIYAYGADAAPAGIRMSPVQVE
ncbi:UTRA domain-containing protein [Streptosporangium sp. NPDC001681]|uniref:UTRA domain-containing protein n=1 Tax=Streptosporangium sp. NPDC001681 TaxID=3154395 RepID=UPI003326BE9B